jgi:RimJ/RimL family protein N-acetyltransferase
MDLPISTPRLLIRPFREADRAAFFAYRNDPDVARFQSWDYITHEAASAFVRTHVYAGLGIVDQWQQLAIALRHTNGLIGDIGLFRREDQITAELGFSLARPYQRRGLAYEAVAAVISALFVRTELERLDAITDARNKGARALLDRLGFKSTSTIDAWFKGEACREHTYSLSRAVWLQSTG